MEHPENQYPKVGVGVMIFKDGKVLLGKRKSRLAQGECAFPGGHFEYMESFEESIKREVREEAGIEIKNVRFLFVANIKAYAPKHYVGIEFVAEWASGEPRVMEPEKCEGWDWYDPEHLPTPLFVTVEKDLEAIKTGRNFWDE